MGERSFVSFNPSIEAKSGSGIILSLEGIGILFHPLFHLFEADFFHLRQEPARGLSGTMFRDNSFGNDGIDSASSVQFARMIKSALAP